MVHDHNKGHYLSWLLVEVDPGSPGFQEAQWIMSEDVNVEHLFNVFTTLDTDSADIWDYCANFMNCLYWYEPQLVVLRPKIEGLPDNHPFKPKCLLMLSMLFSSVGHEVERKRLLVHALELWREQGDSFGVVKTLGGTVSVKLGIEAVCRRDTAGKRSTGNS